MHDPTEGGLATALWEVAEACGHGLEVDSSAVTVLDETAAVCRVLDIDPWGLIASGSLLIMVKPEAESHLLKRLTDGGFDPAVIGRVSAGEGSNLCGKAPELPRCAHLNVMKSHESSSQFRPERGLKMFETRHAPKYHLNTPGCRSHR